MLDSPFKLSEKLPEPSTILSCNYHCHSKFCESQGVVGDKDFFLGNFFGCQMSPIHPTEKTDCNFLAIGEPGEYLTCRRSG